jgi:hypothetical protein
VPQWAHDCFDKLPPASRPPFHWIFMGPGGTNTPLHVDPLLTHAWLAQVCTAAAEHAVFQYCADTRSQIIHSLPSPGPSFPVGLSRASVCSAL